MSEGKKKYSVTVEVEWHAYKTYEVEAEDDDEACNLATEEAEAEEFELYNQADADYSIMNIEGPCDDTCQHGKA
jgi:hypothetical protein